MQAWFADTYYFLALRNPKDEGHAKAVAVTGMLSPRKLVTTTWVLTEVADGLAKPANRPGFALLMEMLSANADAIVLPPSQALFEEGITLFKARADKEWSLTDC